MAEHNERGHKGEAVAAGYLERQGYTILERNWRCGHLEIDLICLYQDMLVIVEVKTRWSPEEHPEEILDRRKRRNLCLAADAYMRAKKTETEVRFDLILVEGDTYRIRHIPDVIQLFDN